MFLRRASHLIATLLLVSVSAALLPAQTPTEILARYTKAVDPEGKLSTIQGFRSEGTFEMAAAGVSASFISVQRRPNLMAMTIVIAGMGEMKQGSDGSTVWANDPMAGPRILTGAEAATFIDGANFSAMVRTPDLFTAMELAGEGDVAGEKCLKVRLTWKSERVTTECYSVTSGLILETSGTQATPQGEIATVGRLSEYKPVGGLLMPHKVVNSMMGFEQVLTITKVEVGEQAPSLFELPPEIKALKKP